MGYPHTMNEIDVTVTLFFYRYKRLPGEIHYNTLFIALRAALQCLS